MAQKGWPATMQSPDGVTLQRGVRPFVVHYRDHARTVELPGYYPEGEGEGIHVGDDMEVVDRALADLKSEVGVPSPDDVRTIRKRLGLSQREAGRIFRVGPNAFDKYERGLVEPSGPTIALMNVVERNPQILADMGATVALPPPKKSGRPKSNPPRRHHYLPEFFLKRWAGADGRVFAYSRPYRDVVRRRVFPSETGFELDLYAALARATPAARQAFETDFMSPLDDLAAKALTSIETTGKRPSDPKLVDAWVGFVLSLMWRSPGRLEFMRRKLMKGEIGISDSVRSRYDALRGEDTRDFDTYRATLDHAAYDDLLQRLVQNLITSEFLGGHIQRMHWLVGTLAPTERPLLLSDDPVMASNGFGTPEGFLILPIGPRAFFMAVNKDETARAFASHSGPGKIARAFNDATAKQAYRLVISASERDAVFIEKRLGSSKRDNLGALERHSWKAPT